MHLDRLDCAILLLLQHDASLTREELAARIGLSASQIARRRAALEAAGIIRRYRAELAPEKIGLGILVFISVKLDSHSPSAARQFAELISANPQILEAHALTGDFDYLLKVRVGSIEALSALVNDRLLPHRSVDRVRSDVVLRSIKDDGLLAL